MDGDRDLYLQVMGSIYTRYRDIVEQIRTELDRADFPAAERLAHTFKGLAGTMGARELRERSLALETAVANRELARIPELLVSLAEEVERVMTALARLFSTEGRS